MAEEPKKEPNKEQESKETPEKKKGNGKKILLWSLGIVFALLLIVVGIVCYVMSALIDHEPLPTVNKVPDHKQYESCLLKFQEKSKQIASDANELAKDQTIILTKGEVNAILDTYAVAGRAFLIMRFPDTTISDVRFEDGVLYADASQKAPFSTPFGQYLNMKLAIIPRVEDNHLYLDVKSLKVGSMELSGDWVQDYIDKELRKTEQTEDGKMALNALKGLKLSPNDVEITFSPVGVATMQAAQLMKLLSSGSEDGEFGTDSLQLLQLLQQLQ